MRKTLKSVLAGIAALSLILCCGTPSNALLSLIPMSTLAISAAAYRRLDK